MRIRSAEDALSELHRARWSVGQFSSMSVEQLTLGVYRLDAYDKIFGRVRGENTVTIIK